MHKTLRNTAIGLAVASIFVISALADRTAIRPPWNLFSPQQDIEMGRLLAGDLEQVYPLVNQSNANTYIDALGRQLVAHAPGTQYPYQFTIVDDDSASAWALPGGFIYVTRGMIQAAQNEPQLAGLLAHQIAHVVLRHGTAAVSQAYTRRVSNRAARGRVSVDDAMSRLYIRFEPDAIPLKYTRDEERQASVLATQILYDARFDPSTMIQMFHTLVSDRSSRTAEFLSAHPNLSNQAAVVRTELRNLGGLQQNIRGDSPDFHSVKDRLYALDSRSWPSISERNRSSRDRPESPSTTMVWYDGRDIEFRYPDNWRVFEEVDSITVAPDGGIVSGSLAYGLTVSTFDPQGIGARTNTLALANATDELVDHMRESNPNLRVLRDTERRRVDGEQAMAVELTNDSPVGGRETVWLVTVLRPGNYLQYFAGAAPEREYSRYRSVFDQIVDSVRFLD